jgi:hypothetical protein
MSESGAAIGMPLMKEMFVNTVKQMVNELDLAFEYIPKDTINKLHKYVDKLQSNETYLNSQFKEIYSALKEHDSTLSSLLTGNEKIRNHQLDFIHDLKVFDSTLDCIVFKNENKNTKKEIAKYLATLYMSSCFLQTDLANISESLESFIKTMQRPKDENVKGSKKSRKQNSGASNLGMFEDLFANPDIMNLANDLTKDLEEKKIEPMSLLTSILSGKPNDTLQELVSDISSKIETKINNGELDKKALEDQAKTMLNAFSSSSTDIPMLGNVLKNIQTLKK